MRIVESNKGKTLLRNISGAFVFKGLGMLLSFFSLPIYMRFFDNKLVLGVWFTILSTSNWIFMFDIGIGNGLRNCLTRELVRGDKKRIKSYISSAYIMITIIAIALLGIGTLLLGYINWNNFFNISENVVDRETLSTTVKIIYVGIILQFIFKIVISILYALQKSAVNNMIAFLTSLFQFMAVLLMPSSSVSENLIRLALVFVVSSNILYIVVTIFAFRDEQLRGCGVSFSYFDKEAAMKTINIGVLFLWTQILHFLIVLTDDYLVTKFTSPKYEVYFSIYYKLFYLVGMAFSLALTPVWSAVTKAQEERDYLWVKKIYKISNLAVILGIICEFCMIAVMQFVVNIWLGDHAIQVDYTYAFIFAVYGSIMLLQSVQETFAYGFGKVMVLCVCYTIGVLVKYSFVYFGTMMYPNAWIIVVLSNILVIVPYCIIQPFYLKREIEKLRG